MRRLTVDAGDYRFCLSNLPKYVLNDVCSIYEITNESDFTGPTDFTIDLKSSGFLRRFVRPQKLFFLDGQRIFNPVSYDKCLPSLEWAMNWCIGSYDHNRLLIHASVIEKNGRAVIFPASQGSGKSTLSAYLGLKQFNLYSDEFAILNLDDGTVSPIFRPASLKNQSIDIIRHEHPDAYFSRTTEGTQKGRIAHVKTMSRKHFESLVPAKIESIITPKYIANSHLEIVPLTMTQAMSTLIRNSFNYNIIGAPAFEIMVDIVSNSKSYALSYSSFGDLEKFLDGVLS